MAETRNDIGYVLAAQRKALKRGLPRHVQLGFSDDKFILQIRDLSAAEVMRISEYLRNFDTSQS